MKNIFPKDFAKIKLLSIFQSKCFLSASNSIFFAISQILKAKFYVFWEQTSKNLKSVKFTDFLSITCLQVGHVIKKDISVSPKICSNPVVEFEIFGTTYTEKNGVSKFRYVSFILQIVPRTIYHFFLIVRVTIIL